MLQRRRSRACCNIGARPPGPANARAWLYFAAVSRVCVICSKHPGSGNNRSHSMAATKRRFDVNLQKIRILVDGAPVRAYVCTRCLKSGRVQKAV